MSSSSRHNKDTLPVDIGILNWITEQTIVWQKQETWRSDSLKKLILSTLSLQEREGQVTPSKKQIWSASAV